MIKFISKSTTDTENFAQEFSKQLKPNDVIAFLGGMGCGKTAFVRGLAKGLNVYGEISSPTFSLVNEYPGKIPLYHFDMYRINDLEDLYSIGFFDYLDLDGILAIEWSENITNVLPQTAIFIEIKKIDDEQREILIEHREQ